MSDLAAPDPQTGARIREVVAAAQGRKAIDLRVLRLAELTTVTDYFLICSGSSRRQVQAIADAVSDELRGQSMRPSHVEGYRVGSWVLMDYRDFVVHIFDEERRRFFGLERLWADASDVTGDFSLEGASGPIPAAQEIRR